MTILMKFFLALTMCLSIIINALAAPASPVMDQALRQANSQWVLISNTDISFPISASVPASDNTTFISWHSVNTATLYQVRYFSNGLWSGWENSNTTQFIATAEHPITSVEVRACDASSCSSGSTAATQLYNPAANSTNATEITFFHNDNAGTPIVATDVFGNVAWKENYRPYGEKLNNDPISKNNKIGFAGKPFDDSTGLSYSGARYYDPVVGRFAGIDPQGFDPENIQSFNRYAYANNNPYKFVDPDGHSPVDVVFLAYDVGKLGVALYTGVGIGAAVADVAMSTVGVISPIPGTGQVLKTARALENGAELVKVADKAADTGKTYQTYIKTNPTTGEVYCGRTSGCGTPIENILARDKNHHMNDKGFGPAQLDQSSVNKDAIRGREQQNIETNGGAKSTGGTSGNAINGIADSNPNKSKYLDAAKKEFGDE